MPVLIAIIVLAFMIVVLVIFFGSRENIEAGEHMTVASSQSARFWMEYASRVGSETIVASDAAVLEPSAAVIDAVAGDDAVVVVAEDEQAGTVASAARDNTGTVVLEEVDDDPASDDAEDEAVRIKNEIMAAAMDSEDTVLITPETAASADIDRDDANDADDEETVLISAEAIAEQRAGTKAEPVAQVSQADVTKSDTSESDASGTGAIGSLSEDEKAAKREAALARRAARAAKRG